jgi:hypothetical protein
MCGRERPHDNRAGARRYLLQCYFQGRSFAPLRMTTVSYIAGAMKTELRRKHSDQIEWVDFVLLYGDWKSTLS